MKEEKSGVVKEECRDDVVGLLKRDTRRLDILSVKKEAKLSADRYLGLSQDDETRLE